MIAALINLFWIAVSGILAILAVCLSVFFCVKARQLSREEQEKERAQKECAEIQERVRPMRRRRYAGGVYA